MMSIAVIIIRINYHHLHVVHRGLMMARGIGIYHDTVPLRRCPPHHPQQGPTIPPPTRNKMTDLVLTSSPSVIIMRILGSAWTVIWVDDVAFKGDAKAKKDSLTGRFKVGLIIIIWEDTPAPLGEGEGI